jgi:hypothetical protein
MMRYPEDYTMEGLRMKRLKKVKEPDSEGYATRKRGEYPSCMWWSRGQLHGHCINVQHTSS